MLSIETPRLYLREFMPKDKEVFSAILKDPVTMVEWPAPYDDEAVDRWLERGQRYKGSGLGRWMVILKETNEVIGDCGVWEAEVNGKREFDLGYILDHKHWGKGLAAEAASAFLDHAYRNTNADRIVANMAESHSRSAKVAEKIGMVLESTFVNAKNRDYPTRLYSVFRMQYLGMRRGRVIAKLADSPEKANWLTLATSLDPANLKVALETAAGIKEEIQKELMFWLYATNNFVLRQKLFDLLNEHNQDFVLRSMGNANLKPLNAHESFAYFMASDESLIEDIQARIMAAGGGLPEHKMLFMKQYQKATGKSLKEARDVLIDLAAKAKDYS